MQNSDRNELAIGFPLIDDTVPIQFFLSFCAMDKPSSYTLLVPQLPHGELATSIATARNSIVRQAIECGCDELLMLDTDQIYPADTYTRLSSHKVNGVVAIHIHRRYPPFEPILLRGELGKYTHVGDEECFSNELVPVDATGTGGMLIDMRVFNEIEEPWFKFDKLPNGSSVGEDIYFCSKLRKANIPIYVDTAVRVGHIITQVVDENFYKLYKAFTGFKYSNENKSS